MKKKKKASQTHRLMLDTCSGFHSGAKSEYEIANINPMSGDDLIFRHLNHRCISDLNNK